MGSFDEYRKRWIYECPTCGLKVTAFRDCGQTSPCTIKCGGTHHLVEIIEPKHIEYDGESYTNIQTFKPYFDVTLGKEVSSMREIKDFCSRNDMVYAGDKELSQQCEQNKRENAIKQDRAFVNGLEKKLMGI